jgi:hypothetical protein
VPLGSPYLLGYAAAVVLGLVPARIPRGKPMQPHIPAQGQRLPRAEIRTRVEHVFAAQSRQTRRTVGKPYTSMNWE